MRCWPMLSAIQTAVGGIQSATDRFDGAAQRIASGRAGGADWGPATQVDLSGTIVDMITAEVGVEMNAAVLRTAGDMQKRLLDILA